jgi:arabinogalactan oligomer / maltooligosaccharide transport system substrate-binding protein
MTVTRISKALLFMVLGTMLLAACTGGQIGESEEESEAAGESADASAAPSEVAFPEGDVDIELWTKEGDPQINFVQQLADDYMAMHDNVTIEVVNKDVEVLREDMVNTALSPDAQPELLWTVADHIGPFVEVDVIQPLDDLIDTSTYDESALAAVQVDGTTWGAPISNGNQLMLYWNKSIVGDDAPADTDELRDVAVENTGDGAYGFVFNVTESFWLVPWLYGFGGSVFEDDGVTPSLDTEPMQNALQFLYDLKYGDEVMPAEVDYDIASGLFTDGQAAMIVNGDWELGNYGDLLGDDLGVGPLPMVSETGEDPKPFTAGSFYMVPAGVEGDTLTVVNDFIAWSTDTEQQVAMVEELRRLPANAEALADPVVVDDPLLAGAAEAVVRGVPQPTNVEMRCVFDAMTAGVRDVLAAGNSDVAGVAATMQETAVTCIEQGAE